MHHAFAIEAPMEEGIEIALRAIEQELGMKAMGNPDVVVLRYGLLTVEDARRVAQVAASAPLMGGEKAIVIAANRAYNEAQNALLKIFEEPPEGMHLFLILPSLGGLLPTLRSRVTVLKHQIASTKDQMKIPEAAEKFLAASAEKRSAIAKQLATGNDEEERRENRDEALTIVNGVEAVAYQKFKNKRGSGAAALLSDISLLRSYLHDRSAPVRLILEHLALVTPKDLLQ